MDESLTGTALTGTAGLPSVWHKKTTQACLHTTNTYPMFAACNEAHD